MDRLGDLQRIVEQSTTIIFDSDGVLVEEGEPIRGAKKFVNYLLEKGKTIIVLSNNSTKHPKTMKNNYHSKGLMVDQIINSSMITAKYCLDNNIRRVFVVGEPGLVEVLQEHEIQYGSENIDAVIVGMDRDLTYQKLARATHLILSGSKFIGTNPDNSFPTPRGLEPGAGSMIAAIEASTGKRVDLIMGKPSKFGYEMVFDTYEVKAEECLMIGDRYETDILGAIEVNIPAIIVNTGIAATREDPGKYKNHPRVPVIDRLEDLIQ